MPAMGGNGLAMRIGMLLEAYATFANVDCLVLALTGSAVDDAAFCRRHARRLDIVEVAGRAETPFALLAAIRDGHERLAAFRAYGRPSLTSFLSIATRQEIRARLSARSYDLVHLSRAYLATLVDLVATLWPGTPIVMDLDEDEPATRRSLATLYRLNGDFANEAWQEAEAYAYQRLLRDVLPSIDLAIVSSEVEAKRTLNHGSASSSLAIIPNAIVVPAAAANSRHAQRLLFVGGFGYYPNRDATNWMLTSIWPWIKARCSGAEAVVVGRNADGLLRRRARLSGVRIHEGIREISTAYRQSSVAIVPIRAGGGTRIKLLEAGAYALPAVSTTLGAEGLIKVPIAIADRAEAFADACVELLRSPALRCAQGNALRRYVRQHHNRGLILSRTVRLLSSLC